MIWSYQRCNYDCWLKAQVQWQKSDRESPEEGVKLDGISLLALLKILKSSKNNYQISILVAVAGIQVHEADEVFNTQVSLSIDVELAYVEALLFQRFRIGAATHLFLPILLCIDERLADILVSCLTIERAELIRRDSKKLLDFDKGKPYSLLAKSRLKILPLLLAFDLFKGLASLPHPAIKLNLKAELLSNFDGFRFIINNWMDLDLKFLIRTGWISCIDFPSVRWASLLSIILQPFLILFVLILGLVYLFFYLFELVVNQFHSRGLLVLVVERSRQVRLILDYRNRHEGVSIFRRCSLWFILEASPIRR